MSRTNRRFPWFIGVSALLVVSLGAGSAWGSETVPQTWLPGDNMTPFQASLPVFGPGYNAAYPRVSAFKHPHLKVTMKEIEQQVLPGYPATRVWAYETSDAYTGEVLGPAFWPAVTIEARRFVPTWVKYVNDLPKYGDPITINGAETTGLVQGLLTVDQAIHWADPLNNTGPMNCHDNMGMLIDCALPENSENQCCKPFLGPVPAVVHLHGAEAFSGVDGGPEQWTTPDGIKGKDYFSYDHPGPGETIYHYQNLQEPGTLWFHDHALGMTRTNVYSGLATFYFIRAPLTEPQNLPKGAYEIEMALQDRQFDINGQLFFPDGSPNGDPNSPIGMCGDGTADDPCLNGPPPNPDIHPFWNPEFFGDVAIVNGAPWPVLQVEPRRYLFRLLDGSNARFYRLTFGDATKGEPKPPVYVIGMDDAYLNAPVKVTDKTVTPSPDEPWPLETVFPLPAQLLIAPGERNYVIVDFTGLQGKTVTLINNAPGPFPGGLLPGIDAGQVNMDKIMQFQVTVPLKGTDTSCNPALGQCRRPIPMVRLADGNGNKAPGVRINKVRQLILKEHQGPGGPIEVLLNNTHWDGLMSPGIDPNQFPDGVTELPQVGSTELWEIINLTMDAHPIHTHLVQFQVLNRESFQQDPNDATFGYPGAWAAAFAGKCIPSPDPTNPCPGYGPPMPYNVRNVPDGALGGNPALSPFLMGDKTPPDREETVWKDTVKTLPGMVTRILARWTPTSIPNWLARPGLSLYAFDPTRGPGYVWHCHILDHEDNEMMRPYKVKR
jgi:spore coat protein A, manganese oxidase